MDVLRESYNFTATRQFFYIDFLHSQAHFGVVRWQCSDMWVAKRQQRDNFHLNNILLPFLSTFTVSVSIENSFLFIFTVTSPLNNKKK